MLLHDESETSPGRSETSIILLRKVVIGLSLQVYKAEIKFREEGKRSQNFTFQTIQSDLRHILFAKSEDGI